MQKLTIIGPGRLGRTISACLSIPHKLVGKNQEIPRSDIYLLTVPDRVISTICKQIPTGGVVLHTSGAQSHEILRPHHPAGVFHPLMTFPGPEISIPNQHVPVRISGDDTACEAAKWLAKELQYKAFLFEGSEEQYHCAAVLAGNCGSLLLHLAGTIMSQDNRMTIDEAQRQLLPLMMQSIQNTAKDGIFQSLTGPIVRGDEETMNTHRRELMSFSPYILRTYNILMESLMCIYQKKEAEKNQEKD